MQIGRGSEYARNTLYQILKYSMKIFLREQIPIFDSAQSNYIRHLLVVPVFRRVFSGGGTKQMEKSVRDCFQNMKFNT